MAPILSLSSLSHSITPESLVWWLARVTLVAGLACAYLALARNARPATRHLIATAGLVAIALLPVASGLLPAWPLHVLRAPAAGMTDARGTSGANPFAIDASSAVSTVNESARPAPIDAPAAEYASSPARESFGATVDWARVAFLVWIAGAMGLLLQIGIAAAGTHRFARRVIATRDERLLLEGSRARRVLGIARPVVVAVSPEIEIPVAVGAFYPCVILPVAATRWPHDRLGVVLLHELAHVRRRDGLWMILARVMTAVLWFHPLVWSLARHVRREAERACDDLVLASGVRGSDYAEHLVSIARTSMVRLPASALAFATRSRLEGRVAFILSASGRRAAMSRRMLVSVAGVSAALFALIAAAHPSADAATPVTKRTDQATRMRVEYAVQNAVEKQVQYQVAGNRDEESGSDWYDRASDYYHKGRYGRAAEAYDRAARLGYRTATAFYNAGCSYALSDEPGKALDALQAAFDEGFDDPDMFAQDEDLNSLRGDPRFRKLLDQVMNTDEAQQRRRAAARDYERLDGRKDAEEGDWNSVGIDLLRSGDYERAATAFDNEFKVSHDEDALYNMACARALGGDTEAALKLLEQAIATGPVSADHMAEDADLAPLHGEKGFDELVEMAEDLELNGTWSVFRWAGDFGKGEDAKRWRRSLSHFENVTEKHPELGHAWFNLGFAQLESGDPAKGTASFTKALDLGYQKPTTMYNLACCAAQSGDADAAFKWLERAEGEGFEVGSHARWDDDLKPLRDDPRYKEASKRWRAAETHAEHEKDKDHYEDSDED